MQQANPDFANLFMLRSQYYEIVGMLVRAAGGKIVVPQEQQINPPGYGLRQYADEDGSLVFEVVRMPATDA